MRGTKHLTAGQKDQVLQLYQETLSAVTTAQRLGVTIEQVRHLLKKHGIRPSNSRGGTCYQNIADVRRWALEGVSLSEIGRRIGTSSSKVSKFLRCHGIPRKRFRQSMQNNPAWRGGRVIDVDGYILCKVPNHPFADRHGYVREHRLVMEASLGRYLHPREVVHHKNKNRADNQLANLQLYASNADHLAEELTGCRPQWTEEGRKRILEALRNRPSRPVSEETRAKLSSALRGRKRNLTPEGREKLRESGRRLQERRRAATHAASVKDGQA